MNQISFIQSEARKGNTLFLAKIYNDFLVVVWEHTRLITVSLCSTGNAFMCQNGIKNDNGFSVGETCCLKSFYFLIQTLQLLQKLLQDLKN